MFKYVTQFSKKGNGNVAKEMPNIIRHLTCIIFLGVWRMFITILSYFVNIFL